MTAIETGTARIIARLKKEGWELERRGGNHDIYRRVGKPGMIVVPRHRVITPGSARSIAKKAGWL
jgi:predicted RNA binding protein YcfA (HicA-like mRNA interferase family)